MFAYCLFRCGTGRGGDSLEKIVRGEVRKEIMTLKLVVRFESSEVQSLSINSLFSVANSEKHSLGNHGGGRTCAKKMSLFGLGLSFFETI